MIEITQIEQKVNLSVNTITEAINIEVTQTPKLIIIEVDECCGFNYQSDPSKLDKSTYTGNAQDLKNEIDAIAFPDGVIIPASVIKTDNVISIEALNPQWRIDNVIYSNENLFSSSIVNATDGYGRTDIVVGTKFGTLVKIQGIESMEFNVPPSTPDNTVLICTIQIFGSTILNSLPPIIGNAYISKNEQKEFIVVAGSYWYDFQSLTFYSEMGTTYRIQGFSALGSYLGKTWSVSTHPFSGQEITIANETGSAFEIKHEVSAVSGSRNFSFPNGLDFTINPNEVVKFRFIDNSWKFIGVITDLTDYYNKTEIDSKISSVYKFKGNVASYAALPSTGLTIGDVYNLSDTGENYAWTGTIWDELGTTIDISGKEDISNKTNTITGNEASTTLYSSVKGIVDWLTSTKIKSLLEITTLSGSNTGDETDISIITKIGDGTKISQTYLPIADLTTSGIVNLVDQNLGKGKKTITANVGDVNISDFVDSNGVVVVGVGNTNRIIKLTDNQTIQAVRIGVLATNDTTTPRTLRIVASGGVDEPSGNLVFEIPSSYAVLGNSGKMKFIAGKNYAWGEYSTIEFITKTTGGVETTVFLIDNIGVPTSNNGLKVISVATTGIGQSITANSITTGSGLDVTTASAALNSTNGFFRVFNNAVVSTPTGLFARIQPNSTSGSGLTVINNGSVGIGTTAPVATAQLQIDSTTKGVLIPRMTLVQRNAIVTPVTSLLIFCTDSVAGGEFEYYNGTTWSSLAGSFNGRVDLNGQITPTILGADTNNYNPIGLASANLINLSSSLNISLTGLIAPSPIGGQMIVLYNNGTNNILIKANSLLSSVGNRFVINADINLQSGESVTIVFNINKNGWIVSGKLI